MTPRLYLATARHLRWEQVAFRAAHALREGVRARAPGLVAACHRGGGGDAPAGARVHLALGAPGTPGLASARAEAADFLAGEFAFVGARRPVGDPIDWRPAGAARLWRYHLHYLDALKPLAALARAGDRHAAARGHALARSWLAAHPVGYGEAWEPYPTSQRLANLLVWAAASPAAARDLAGPCAAHARWLAPRLERHLLGNHLVKNLKALLLAGLALEGPAAARWRATARARLEREVRDQVLADGGHVERSPMYHLVVLEDLLELAAACRATGRPAPAFLTDAAARMARFAERVLHPDGEVPLLNDAALGQAPPPRELLALADGLGLAAHDRAGWRRALWTGTQGAQGAAPARAGVTHLAATGLVVVRAGPAALVFDVGPLGPDHLPGHGHADTLSFELSLDGARWVVDGGTAGYEDDPFRAHLRSAAAHNTVAADGQSTDELWGCFRVARRSRPGPATTRQRDGVVHLRGAVQSAFGWAHRRDLFLWPTHGLVVVDRVDGARRGAVARVHFHPDVRAAAAGATVALARAGAAARLDVAYGGAPAVFCGAAAPCEGWVALRLGPPAPAPVVRVALRGGAGVHRAAYALAWTAGRFTLAPRADGFVVHAAAAAYHLRPEGAFYALRPPPAAPGP